MVRGRAARLARSGGRCASPRFLLASLVFLVSFVSLALACAHRAPPPLSDLGGVEWVLTHFDDRVPAPDAPVVTLAFEGERVVGSAGCNRYFGGCEEGASEGELVIGLIGSTRKMCAPYEMGVEARFLAALQHVVAYRVEEDALRLTSRRAGVARTLAFERRESR